MFIPTHYQPTCKICTLPAALPERTCGAASCRRLWQAYKARKRALRAAASQRRADRQRQISAPLFASILDTCCR